MRANAINVLNILRRAVSERRVEELRRRVEELRRVEES